MTEGKKQIDPNAIAEPQCICCSDPVDMEQQWNLEFMQDVADLFKVFGDTTRIRILQLLLEGELCVGDVAHQLQMSQSAVSHQLRVLRQNNLVKYRKDGKVVYYSLDDDHVKTVLEQGMGHIAHKKGYSNQL